MASLHVCSTFFIDSFIRNKLIRSIEIKKQKFHLLFLYAKIFQVLTVVKNQHIQNLVSTEMLRLSSSVKTFWDNQQFGRNFLTNLSKILVDTDFKLLRKINRPILTVKKRRTEFKKLTVLLSLLNLDLNGLVIFFWSRPFLQI